MKAGQHQVELSFHPKSVERTETIAYVAFVLLLLAVAAVVFVEWKKQKKTVAS